MAERGAAAFEQFYGELYGDRWEALRRALLETAPGAAFSVAGGPAYFLDAASVIAAAALETTGEERVLDLCAAPGGKSLVLAGALISGKAGTLVCNERSSARRARLHRVLDEHLPSDIRGRVTVTPHDATRWALHEPASYDRVLADVPCSSEQHVIQSAGALAEWSPSRTRRLSKGAYAIACAAVDTVRPGGRVVYSTCALSPIENDGVIVRILARGAGSIEALDPGPIVRAAMIRHAGLHPAFARLAESPDDAPVPGGATEHGWLFLPDADGGLGPIYLAVLERRG